MEAEARKVLGGVPKLIHYTARSAWIARLTIEAFRARFTHVDSEERRIAFLVAAQENACRYCYGTLRAQLRILGYSDAHIARLETDLELAELNPRGRALIRFARQLAQANPRPALRELEALIAAGFLEAEATEIAWLVALACFVNRVATFVAAPLESDMEAMPDRFLVRVFRPLI